jgi:outer membrane protein assembly factor BamD (BamD/ComL family)
MADPAQQRVMQEYESALRWMQEGRFEKARDGFAKITQGGPPELMERARVYLQACERHATKQERTFTSPEEQYDYAISLLNTGFFEEAREQFEGILEREPKTD